MLSKFDPAAPARYPARSVYAKLESLRDRKWRHGLGDGKASERIYRDLVQRLLSGKVARHRPGDYHLKISRSYREDGISVRKAVGPQPSKRARVSR